jgi:hypothetical protein
MRIFWNFDLPAIDGDGFSIDGFREATECYDVLFPYS